MGLATSKQEAFWEACGFGHVNRVRRFIEEGTDVNWVSYTHNSCAIHVASQGKPEIVKMLIDAHCNVNAKDDRGNLALHHAAMKGHADIMQMLIDAGSEINTQDKNGWTPLLNAAYFCQPDAVETLIKNNCDVNLQNKDERTALHEACRSQSKDENGLAIIVCHLVEANTDINAKSSDVGEADFTPLMFAAYHGHADVAEVLVEAGCDINAQGSNGWTALHWAVDRGHKDVARVLMKWGIDPLIEGRRGELALDRAQDNSLRELLAEVTLQAKDQRDIDNMVSHSPVSTTSPLSSSCSSSLGSDIDNIHDNDKHIHTDVIIDNDLACKLEAINVDSPGSEQGAESSCTSGTVSEKDEKEPLEKDVIQKSHDTQPPEGGLPSDGEMCGTEPCVSDKLEECTEANQVNGSDGEKPIKTSETTPNNAVIGMLDSTNDDTLDQVSEINTDTKNGEVTSQVSEPEPETVDTDTPGQVLETSADATSADTLGQVSDVSTGAKSDDTAAQVTDITPDTKSTETRDHRGSEFSTDTSSVNTSEQLASLNTEPNSGEAEDGLIETNSATGSDVQDQASKINTAITNEDTLSQIAELIADVSKNDDNEPVS